MRPARRRRCPTSTIRRTAEALVAAVNALRAQGRCSPTTTAATAACSPPLCEMAFAGHVGVSLNVDLLVTEGDGIADSRADYGDAKNWATRSARGARS